MSDADEEQANGNGDGELEDDVDDQVPADAGGEKEGADNGDDESGEGEASADSSEVSFSCHPEQRSRSSKHKSIVVQQTCQTRTWESVRPSQRLEQGPLPLSITTP